MPRAVLSRWLAFGLGAVALAAAAAAALLSFEAITKARMPYNEAGRYFDGLVVHDESSAYVFSALAVLFWVVAALTALGARRLGKRTGAAPQSGANELSKP